MDLEDLQKQLYKDRGLPQGRPEAPKPFEPGKGSQEQGQAAISHWQTEEVNPQSVAKTSWEPPESKKNLKLFIAGVLIIFISLASFFIWRSLTSFNNSKVSLIIFGPERIVSGEEVHYIIKFKNNTKFTLGNVKFTFIYPDGAIAVDKNNLSKIGGAMATIKEIPDVAAGQEGQIELRANISGFQNDQKKATAKMSYRPIKISSEYEKSAEFSSIIFSVPLVLDFDLPERVVNGQQLSFAIKYVNTAEISFSNLALKIEYPEGFNFASSLRPPDQGSDLWFIDEISAKEEGKISVEGTLGGTKDEVKSFTAKIIQRGDEEEKAISQTVDSALVSVSPLLAELKINDARDYNANPGERLHYQINYENTVDVPLNSVFIVLKFDTRVLDFTTLKADKGFFNNLDNSITWNESSVPDLKILQSGEKKSVDFYIKVKDRLPITGFSDKNFTINSSVKIDSSNIPISLRGTQVSGVDSLNTKLNSKLILYSRGYFFDASIPNSGPLPPIVGQQTNYNIEWSVLNLANDAENVVVESYLPPYVRWLEKFEPGNADIKYDQNSGKITWKIGKLAANTGILSLVKRIVFQVGLIPASNQVGDVVELIKESMISGKDMFTAVSLSTKAPSVQSDLPDDPSMTYEQGRVKN